MIVLGLTLVFPLLVGPLGYYGYDEGLYHLMIRAFESSGNLHVWNGYEELPADQFVLRHVIVHDGRLASPYPYLFAVVAAPIYGLFGFGGLFFINGLAYAGTVALCIALAQRLLNDKRLSISAGLIFVFATFGWQYSQAVWPHGLSMFIVVSCVYLGVLALDEKNRGRSIGLALASGVMAGFGAGIRLDNFFVLPAIIVPLFLARPSRLVSALAVCVGAIPGLAVLTYTNYLKFGVMSPFSYGTGLQGSAAYAESYLPIFFAGGIVVLAIWARMRWPAALSTTQKRAAITLSAVAGLACIWFAWPLLARFADGFYQLVVDLRIRNLNWTESGLSRGPGGSMVYTGAVQKSLLQSCPYLVAAVIPLVYLLRNREGALRLSILFLAPVTYVSVFSYFSWHGGLTLHIRYFVITLPFTSILMAWAWRDVARPLPHLGRYLMVGSPIAVLLIVVAIAMVGYGNVDATHEFVLLTLPLILAAIVLVLSLMWMMPGGNREGLRRFVPSFLTVSLLLGFVWSGTVAFVYDFPRDLVIRKLRTEILDAIAPVIKPDSLVLARPHHNIMGLFSKDRVRLARLESTDLKASRPLIDHHHRAGRIVYLWLEPDGSGIPPAPGATEAEATHAGLRLVPLYEGARGRLFQLLPKS